MKVVSIVDSPFEYKDGIILKYGLTKNKVYTLAESDQISSAPNNDDFIHVVQIDGKVIPHSPENFITIDEWREKQIKKILKSN